MADVVSCELAEIARDRKELATLRAVRDLLDEAVPRQVLKEGHAGDLRPNSLEDGERLVLPRGADRDLPRLLLDLDVAIRARSVDVDRAGR